MTAQKPPSAWNLTLRTREGDQGAVRKQRATAHRLADAVEAGAVLTGLHAAWVAGIIEVVAANPPRSKGRPRKNAGEVAASFQAACARCVTALRINEAIGAVDRPHAAAALRAWARGLGAAKVGAHRPAKVPPEAAIEVGLADKAGRSKRAVVREIAEREGVDARNVERAVAQGRGNAEAFRRWLGLAPKK